MNETRRKKGWIKITRRAGVFIGICLAALLSVSFIVHIPAVQAWGIRHITAFLSQKSQSTVEIRQFGFNIFDHLELSGFYVEKPGTAGDTLLYADKFKIRFSNILSLTRNQLHLREILMRDAQLNITRAPDDMQTDLSLILSRLLEPSKRDSIRGNQLVLTVSDFQAQRLRVIVQDSASSSYHAYYLPSASIDVDVIDFRKKLLSLNAIRLQGAHIAIEKSDATKRARTEAEPTVVSRDTTQWRIRVGRLTADDAQFSYQNPERMRPPDSTGVDYANLLLSDIQLDISDLYAAGQKITSSIRNIAFEDHSGFTLTQMQSREAIVCPDGISFNDVQIVTPQSFLGDTLQFAFEGFEAFGDFADKVDIYGTFHDTRIALGDLMLIVPALQHNALFRKNAAEVLHVDGVVSGHLNRLLGRNIQLRLGDIVFAGSFKSRDLAVRDAQFLNLDVALALLSAKELNKRIPGLLLPPQFYKLGTMQFSGQFDGFFQDFVTYGEIQTNLGKSILDMHLDVKSGARQAAYSGSLELVDFNLRKWTGDPELGRVSAVAEVKEGQGLTSETAHARLEARIRSLEYKGFRYEDVQIDGLLDNNFFDGALEIHQDAIDLSFLGKADFRDSVPRYDFEAMIAALDLHTLNFTQDTINVQGRFDVSGSGRDLNSISGTASVSNVLVTNGQKPYTLDTLHVRATLLDSLARQIVIHSDYANGTIQGEFEWQSIYPGVAHYLAQSYPRFFANIPYKWDSTSVRPQINLNLTLSDPEGWTGLLDLNLPEFTRITVQGRANLQDDDVALNFDLPELHMGQANIYNTTGTLIARAGIAETHWNVAVVDYNTRYFFDDIAVNLTLHDENIEWELQAEDVFEAVNRIDMRGTYARSADSLNSISFKADEITLFGRSWRLNPSNSLSWRPGYIDIRNLTLSSRDQTFIIDDVQNRGIRLEMDGFDASYVNEVWNEDRLEFAGSYQLEVSVKDIFERSGFDLVLDVPELSINGNSHGHFYVDGVMKQAGDPVLINLSIEKPGANIRSNAIYYPPLPEVAEEERSAIYGTVAVDTFPLDFLEYIIGDGISDTRGSLIGEVDISGFTHDIQMNGSAIIKGGATTVNYLGTRYTFDNQRIRLTSRLIDFTGAVLRDTEGNRATITGGLTHRYLADLGLSVRIQSPEFVALNTSRADNPLYYGYGVGAIDVSFSGTMQRPNIAVNATTAASTYMAIPVGATEVEQNENFLRFSNTDTTRVLRPEPPLIRGVNFDMNLTVTPDALLEIILDETTQEAISGNGEGDLQLSITRTGDFSMYGLFEVEYGSYLFRNFIITKPFDIRRGSTIRWTGDPLDAELNIEADYLGLRTQIYTLVEEYMTSASEAAEDEANRKTEVELKLILTGSLLYPNIDFEIRFPNITGELAGYVNSKMRILESNQNALNEQVFGLLWAGTFLPSNVLHNESTGQIAGSGSINTVTQWASNQLSTFLSDALQRVVADVGFISGVDFDVGWNRTYNFNQEGGGTYNEWELRVRNRLFDDRFVLDVGGNYAADNPAVEGAYFVGDYALEYILTRDRRLKVRFYQRIEETIEGRKNKLGLGLSYRREFDSFGDWLKGLEKETRRTTEESIQEDGGPVN